VLLTDKVELDVEDLLGRLKLELLLDIAALDTY